MKSKTQETTQSTIERIYDQYHRVEYLTWDPLLVAHRFKGQEEQELIALISALFAFGGVKQILASIDHALDRLGCAKGGLLELLSEKDEKTLAATLSARLKGFKHRIYVHRDLVALLLLYRRSKLEFGSLRQHFLKHHRAENETIEQGLAGLIEDYRNTLKTLPIKPGAHFNHMLNSPASQSVCKRWVMYLKWMVRENDGIDLGLWSGSNELRPDQLVIPLDTHLFRISKKLRLTRKKTANWKTALEVSQQLKKIDPLDPTRFDFSLCRWGMFEYRKLHK